MNRLEVYEKFEKQMLAISQYLKELRFAENQSQSEVSYRTGIHRNSISNIENSKNYEILTLLELCDYYQISVSELFSINDET